MPRPSPARANIEIEVRGVDDQLRNNVLAYLSFDRYRKSESLSADTLERLHNRVEREVAAALKPFGYYEPKTKCGSAGSRRRQLARQRQHRPRPAGAHGPRRRARLGPRRERRALHPHRARTCRCDRATA